jgi:hypothetical protein
MPSFSAAFLSRRAQDLRAGFRHAFAVRPEQHDFTVEDLALLEQVAQAIVTRGMATPASLFLESMGPMNFLGSQALHFLSPIIECAMSGTELSQVARLLERRDTISRLTALIEAKAAPSPGAPAR